MDDRVLLTVRGRSGAHYSFVCDADKAHMEEWRADGLDVAEVGNVIPHWVAELGLVRPWCRLQDLWRLVWA